MTLNQKMPTLAALRARNAGLAAVRNFFNDHGYLEIQTRTLRETTATDPYIESFQTHGIEDHQTYYMQTSPEYAHKIFLSHRRMPIYEIAHVFRNEISGLLHRPEFTLIEWYEPECDYNDMMNQTEALVKAVAKALETTHFRSQARVDAPVEIPVEAPFERLSVADAFRRYAGFDWRGLSHSELYDHAVRAGSRVQRDWSYNDIFNCVLVDFVEPNLGMIHPTFLCDYPASMASLATVKSSDNGPVAERFELYIGGIEICNGYSELNDANELRKRFQEDNEIRNALHLETLPIDETLLEALPQLGKLGGNALGYERLLMICLGLNDISQIHLDF